LPKLLHQLRLVGVGERRLEPLQGAVLGHEIDDTRVAERRDGELGQTGERRLVVERRLEQTPGLGQEALRLLRAHALRDVMNRDDPVPTTPALVANRGDVHEHVECGAVFTDVGGLERAHAALPRLHEVTQLLLTAPRDREFGERAPDQLLGREAV
jgi:hypothetical protein